MKALPILGMPIGGDSLPVYIVRRQEIQTIHVGLKKIYISRFLVIDLERKKPWLMSLNNEELRRVSKVLWNEGWPSVLFRSRTNKLGSLVDEIVPLEERLSEEEVAMILFENGL